MARYKAGPATANALRIEALLQEAYANYADLRALRDHVAAAGIQIDALPNDRVLHAFCLLFDHHRQALLARLSPYLPILAGKGLIADTAGFLSTPVVRFYVAISHLLEDLLDVSQRFASGLEAAQDAGPQVAMPVIRCASEASGFFGQEVRIRAHILGAEWLLVRPDPIFGLAETLLHVKADCPITIPLPCDEGDLLIAAMDASGKVSAHTLCLSLLREASV
jgi:hypothetical protein